MCTAAARHEPRCGPASHRQLLLLYILFLHISARQLPRSVVLTVPADTVAAGLCAAAGPGALSLQQQGYVVLLATLLTLAPLQEAGEPGEAEADAQALGEEMGLVLAFSWD